MGMRYRPGRGVHRGSLSIVLQIVGAGGGLSGYGRHLPDSIVRGDVGYLVFGGADLSPPGDWNGYHLDRNGSCRRVVLAV